MTVKEIKKELKEMEVEYDTFSFLSERVPNLFFTFIIGQETIRAALKA